LKVAEPSPSRLETGQLFASRFEAQEPIAGDRVRRAFTGVDRESGASVILVELTAEDLPHFERARSTSHAHMARLIDLIPTPDGGVLISERVAGTTLRELLGQIVRKTSVDAVRSALRVADAVSALHANGAAHGWLDPSAIVAEPEGHPAPVVTWLPPERGASSYRSPSQADPPSEADDTWALAALLHLMLTGEPPPAEGFDTDDKRLEASILDDALRTALAHGLARDEELRAREVRPFKRELARWFVEHAGEETSISGHPHPHSRPPPLPPGASSTPPAGPASVMPHSVGHVPAVASSTPPAPRPAPRRLMAVLGAALVVGVVAAWAVSAIRSKPRVVEVAVPATAQAPASAKDKEIALNEIPVTGQSDALTGDKMATCVAAYLPKGSLAKTPDVSWMCKERDPREGGGKLRTAVVQGAAAGPPNEAMKLFSRLGWYEMAAFAVIRAGCCEEAEAITLPDPSPNCKRMDEPLQQLGQAVIESQNHEAYLKSFTDVVLCEVGAGRAGLYRRAGRPQGGEDTAFQDLVKVIQTP
jgi:hypothetical protein